jgi:hypothetical protein
MSTETYPLIHAKMSAVMADLNAISKDRNNAQQGYKFRGIDDVLNALHGPLSKHGVSFTAAVRDVKQREYATKTGTAMLHITLIAAYTFRAADGSSVTYEAFGEASDSGDKAGGKAQAYSLKVALIQAFCIPTEEQKDTEYSSPEQGSSLPQAIGEAVLAADAAEVQAVWDAYPSFQAVKAFSGIIAARNKKLAAA